MRSKPRYTVELPPIDQLPPPRSIEVAISPRNPLPAGALPVQGLLPRPGLRVIGWLSYPEARIWFEPAIVWTDQTGPDTPNRWLTGISGHRVDLRSEGWVISHWMPLPGGEIAL